MVGGTGNRIDSVRHESRFSDCATDECGGSAFTLRELRPSPVPVLISVPHAGRSYPAGMADQLRHDPEVLRRLEDRLVDRLAEAVARETGAALLVAQAPRAMIDLNRGIEDMDWEMVEGHVPSMPSRPSRRARSGLGLVPRRLPGLGELWKGPLSRLEFDRRLHCIHQAYHDRLDELLQGLRNQWGAALLIDLHSMPPLRQYDAEPAARFVLGDRFGASCAECLSIAASDYFVEARQHFAVNRPYAGGYVLERHGRHHAGLHALQIEVCRSLYLDAGQREATEGVESVAGMLSGLVRKLAHVVAALGRSAPMLEAAE